MSVNVSLYVCILYTLQTYHAFVKIVSVSVYVHLSYHVVYTFVPHHDY